jgi:hypothetical protein
MASARQTSCGLYPARQPGGLWAPRQQQQPPRLPPAANRTREQDLLFQLGAYSRLQCRGASDSLVSGLFQIR